MNHRVAHDNTYKKNIPELSSWLKDSTNFDFFSEQDSIYAIPKSLNKYLSFIKQINNNHIMFKFNIKDNIKIFAIHNQLTVLILYLNNGFYLIQ